MVNIAEQAERIRDLKSEISGMATGDMEDVLFQDISPGRTPVTLYSLADGSPEKFPAYMVPTILSKRRQDGSFAFTADPDKAPAYKLGNVKCFLNPNSAEWPILQELGLGGKECPAMHLASASSKRVHGLHRHKHEWAGWQEYVVGQREQEGRDRQDKQLEATLAIANRTGVSVETKRRARK